MQGADQGGGREAAGAQLARSLTARVPVRPIGWRRASIAAAMALVGWPGVAIACTLCGSPQAVSVRTLLFGSDWWWTGAAVLLPLPILLSIVAAVSHEPRKRGGADDAS